MAFVSRKEIPVASFSAASSGALPASSLWMAFVGVALIYMAFLPPGIFSVDGNSMLGVAESIARRFTFETPPVFGILGADGRYYSQWYPLLSIIAAPWVGLGYWIGRVFHLPPHYVAAVFGVAVNIVITAAIVPWVQLLAVRLGAEPRRAFEAGFIFAFGTFSWVYARTFFAEPLLAVLTVAALYWGFGESPKEIRLAGLAAGLAVLAKPTGIILGPILTFHRIVFRKDSLRTALLPMTGTILGAALYLFYNYYRFGRAFNFGERPGFGWKAFPEAVTGLLVSPGRGLLWFAPPLLVLGAAAMDRWKTHKSLIIGGVCLGYLTLYSLRPADWYGGVSWGPRFLFPVLACLIPFVAMAKGPWRKVLWIAAAAGLIIHIPTLFCFYERFFFEAASQGVKRREVIWSPIHSPILGIWPSALRTIEDSMNRDVKEIITQAGSPSRSMEDAQFMKVVAVWWWVLPAVHLSRWIGVGVSLILIGLGAVFLVGAYRRLAVESVHPCDP